ncbi:MAG: hypothetical protein M1817_006195 [Caeruleum heppii]|nr:MAG: hypothetical protein M1817_006195 [Caeruleum heppii]
MTCNITTTPRLPDPLPLYTPRGAQNTDTSSIHSDAPSYTSATPSYHSSAPRHEPPRIRHRPLVPPASSHPHRPSPYYAPGFGDRGLRAIPTSSFDVNKFNVSSWSSMGSSQQPRLYQSVAHRRANVASAATERQSMFEAAAQVGRGPSQLPITCAEHRVLEDPHLVGTEAAEQTRRERLLRRRRGDEVLRQEDKAWDFLVRQMAEWEERDKSWARFRKEIERPGILRRRLGLRKGP